MLSKLKYFTRAELTLWGCSVLLIVGSFVLFHQTDYLTLTASLIGATSLILNAKGNPAGQVLDHRVQPAVRLYLADLRLLRRDDHLPGHDGAHVGVCAHQLAAQPL